MANSWLFFICVLLLTWTFCCLLTGVFRLTNSSRHILHWLRLVEAALIFLLNSLAERGWALLRYISEWSIVERLPDRLQGRPCLVTGPNGEHGQCLCVGHRKRQQDVWYNPQLARAGSSEHVRPGDDLSRLHLHHGRLRSDVGTRILTGQGIRNDFVHCQERHVHRQRTVLPCLHRIQGQEQGQGVDRVMHHVLLPVCTGHRDVFHWLGQLWSLATPRQPSGNWDAQRGRSLRSFKRFHDKMSWDSEKIG